MKPLVSVNIATYNSEKTLRKCLESVKNQTYKDIEIIIMDSYSKDKTRDIAESFGAKIVTAPSLALAREAGVNNSKGKYIMILDSDQVMEDNSIKESVRACEDEGYDAVTLFEQSLITKNTLVERIIAYDKWLFHSLHDDDSISGSAIPRFFKTEYLRRINFRNNPPITFEHSIIHNEVVKMGAKIKFLDVYIYHHETTTLRQVFRKFFRYGFYYIPALKKEAKLVLAHSLPRRAYFSKKAFTKPLYLLGVFFIYFVKAFASALGALSYVLNPSKRNTNL